MPGWNQTGTGRDSGTVFVVSSERYRRIDAHCLAFEDELIRKNAPRMEDFLSRVEAEDRSGLLYELLILEASYGHKTDADSLNSRFPDHALVIRRALDWSVDGSSRPRLEPGRLVGRYRIGERIGEGRYSEVFLATDTELDRQVAIKSPKMAASSTQRDLANLVREAQMLAQLRHPNLLTIHDVIQVEHQWPLFILEYLDGEELPVQSPWDDQKLDWLIRICRGLDYAHGKGLVHRDIKPSNIVIDSAGRPVLVDFGLAIHADESSQRAGEAAGTLNYMSPEQVCGEAQWMDGRADIWSIGVILYQLLTGRLPFSGDTISGIAEAIVGQPVRPPRQLDAKIPKSLEEICLRCLAKDPEDRYPTAADLADALDHFRHPIVHARRWGLRGMAAVLVLTFLAWTFVGLLGNADLVELPAALERPTPDFGPTDASQPPVFRVELNDIPAHPKGFSLGLVRRGQPLRAEVQFYNPTSATVPITLVRIDGDAVPNESLFGQTVELAPGAEHRALVDIVTDQVGDARVKLWVQSPLRSQRIWTVRLSCHVWESDSDLVQIIDAGPRSLGVNVWDLKRCYESHVDRPNSYGNDHLSSEDPDWTVQYVFDVSPGKYSVATTWGPEPSLSRDAFFVLLDPQSGNRLGTRVDQRTVPNDFRDGPFGWKRLGEIEVEGNRLEVVILPRSTGHVIADAVRVEPLRRSPERD